MHILIIPSEEYIPKYSPIAGIFQHDQAKILNKKGHAVGALSFAFNYSIFSLLKATIGKKNQRTKQLSFFEIIKLLLQQVFFPQKLSLTYENIDQINVIRCEGSWGIKKNNSSLSIHEMWMKYGESTLFSYIKKYGKPDIIHAHNVIYAGLLASFIHDKLGIPIIITEHSSQYAMQEIPKELNEKIEECLQNQMNLFAVSPKLIQLLESKYTKEINKIEWLPNVIDPKIEQMKLNGRTPDQIVRFLTIGNLIPLKGQEELIRAFHKVFKNEDDVELIIAGEGYLKDQLSKIITELQMDKKIKLIGFINRKEVVRQMDQSNVFVLPSHYETFGVVLIEALSRGVPVISTFCGGPECIVNKDNGILIKPKNIDELAEALHKMYHNCHTYDRQILRNSLINNFGSEAFYNRVIKIYESVIAKSI